MADPIVGITNGVPTSGTGNITTLGQTLVDGANATHGITTGAAVTTDVAGTFQQYLRGLVKLIAAAVAGGAGSLFAKITDGTNTATVKAASTAPVTATDSALVTVIRPDSAGIIATGTAGAPSSTVLTVQGFAATPSRINAAASTNATNVKASAGTLYTIDIFNVAAYNVFLKLYNKATAPTVGTDTPIATIPIQAGGGYSKTWQMGLPFSTGISYAITKLQADSDTTVVVAGDLTGNLTWI